MLVHRRVNVPSGSPFESEVGYSRAVRTGEHIAVAGTTAPGESPAAQTREALRRIEVALGEVGASLSDVVRTRIFVTDIRNREQVWRARREFFTGNFPASTLVEVRALADPGLKVEIEAVAYLGAGAR